MDYLPSARFLITLFVLGVLVDWVLEQMFYRGIFGFQAYALARGSALLIIIVLGARKVLKEIPPGLRVVSEKSVSMTEPFEVICDAVPAVVAKNHWKLLDADKREGHFKVKIGMSLHTIGSTMLIDVSKTDGGPAKVHVLCGTRSLNDPGHNDKMIAKFYSGLEDSVKSSKL